MDEAKGAATDGSASTPLSIVLGHLNSSDDARQLCSRTARTLHRVSKQHQADARATLRHLALDRYYKGLKSAHPDASSRPAAIPWDLLTACPAVTFWKLHPEQLECFQDPAWTLDEDLAAAASRIKRLEVWSIRSCDKQQEGFGRLLWACNQLEEVAISCEGECTLPPSWRPKGCPTSTSKPWLLLDPNSTSASTVKGPPLPLRSWISSDAPDSLIYAWLEQQQQEQGQMTHTLRKLSLSDGLDLEQLKGLRGLEEVLLGTGSFPLPPGISSSLRSISKVTLWGPKELPGSLSSLPRLSSLKWSYGTLPLDLGVQLPNLQQLVAPGSTVEVVPLAIGGLMDPNYWNPPMRTALTSLTGLTRLALMGCQDRHALPAGLVRLKELDIRGASLSLQHISSWTALEVLDAADSDGLKDVALLRPLTRLRHLSLENLRSLSPSSSTSFTVLGAMQQLTHLNLRSVGKNPTPACCAALAGTNPLPALQQLDLSGQEVGSYAALAPWVAKLTALTSLNLSGGKVAEGDELLYLPTQLRELHLAAMEDMGEVPRGVLRLPALELLSLGYNQGLDQLPSWLSELRQLELLDLDNTHIWQEQQVLAQLPALRCITLPYGLWQTPAVLYANVPHLHWGHSDRFISWRGRNYVDR